MIRTDNCASDVAHYKDTSLHEKGTNERDQQLAGFIFMCNGRSKPQCYQYRVFGLPLGRMELVKKIKPGMKLFLYDFEMKLLYGLYEATTIGTLNLEQAAFNGRFPAQVGFKIYKDCMPLHESSFKHAIEHDHQNSNKFNQELNKQQVENLLSMFRPLTTRAHSSLLPMLHQDVPNQSSLTFYKKPCTQVIHSIHVQQARPWQHDPHRTQLGKGQVDPVMKFPLPLNLVDPNATGIKLSYLPTASEQPYHVPPASEQPYHVPPASEHPYHVPPASEQSYHVLPASEQSYHVPPASEHPYYVPPASEQPYYVPPASEQPYYVPTASEQPYYVLTASEQPYYVPQAVPSLQQQHVGSTTNIGYSHQTMGKQVFLTENDQNHLSEVQQRYGTMGVNEQLVTRNWRQLPF